MTRISTPTWESVVKALKELRNERVNARCSKQEKGIFQTAEEILLETSDRKGGMKAKATNQETAFLGGAPNWQRYAEGACSQCFSDVAIAERYCTPSQLRRNRHGELPPRKGFSWMDVEAAACYAAWRKICIAYHNAAKA